MREEYNATNIDNIYQLIAKEEAYINPIVDGNISWDHDSSYRLDLEEELENWKNILR